MSNILKLFQTVYSSASSVISYVYTFILTLADFNFKAVTVTVETCQDIAAVIINFIKITHNLFANVISSAVDFLLEIFSLLYAVLLVLWKFVVFIGSLIHSAYQLIELVLYFIISNAILCSKFIAKIAYNFKDCMFDAFSSACNFFSWIFAYVAEALTIIGTGVLDFTVSFCQGIKWALVSCWKNLDEGMMSFADGVRYITDTVYYSLIDLMHLKQETYLGLLICLITFLFVANIFKSLKQRGMTFPGIRENLDGRTNMRPNFGFDFSDNEEEDSDNNTNDESDETVASSDISDGEDDVEEYEIDDLTTDDELSDSSGSIDIQLPPVSSGSYNLRRSTTPSRFNINTSEDFQKEIEKEKEKTKCVVCQDNDKSVLILPCRHLCLCLPCGNTIARSRNVDRRVCPLCRKKIETIMNVYT